MTARRPQRKLSARIAVGAAPAATALLPAIPLRAATTERIVVEGHTGLAIGGYDPVAYFIEQRAVARKGDIEYAFGGGVWRFRNEGNRAAFSTDPAVYMLQFGGYDPVGIVRGVTVPGNPRLWHIVGDRLFLFYTADAQALFIADAERIIAIGGPNGPRCNICLRCERHHAGSGRAAARHPGSACGSPQAMKDGISSRRSTRP